MLLPDQTYDDYDKTRAKAAYNKRKVKTQRRHCSQVRSKSSSSSSRCGGGGVAADTRSQSTGSTGCDQRIADFFNNIPDFVGDFPAFLLARSHSAGHSTNDARSHDDDDDVDDEEDGVPAAAAHGHSSSPANSMEVLRQCENFLCRNRMRPDFFCQYQKALSTATNSAKEAEAKLQSRQPPMTVIRPKVADEASPNARLAKADKVERFTKFSAIYTLPVAKRKKSCNKTTAGNITDASSSNEAVHLQQRLKSLSTELVTLRNRLHVGQTGNGGVATHQQQQQQQPSQQQQQQTSSGVVDLHASSPNLTSGGGGGGNGGVTALTAIQQHAGIISTLNHHTTLHGNDHHQLSKHQHSFSQTLPHNSSTGAGTGVVSSRNTSIPHPLPHQINEKSNGNAVNAMRSFPDVALPVAHANANLSHTLPLRSNAAGHLNSQQLPFIPVPKHMNPCQSINTLPFGYANSLLTANNNNHNSHNNGNTHESTKLSNFGGGLNGFSSGFGSCSTTQNKLPQDMADLIHLPGPLTEHAVMRTLQARFNEHRYFTNVGPILLSINPYLDVGNPLTLSSTRSLPLAPQLHKIVQEAVRQQAETGYPQAIILSGTSGAGKTHCSMLLLRQLFAIAGGGPETDAFKHLAAAFTVLRSLGSAKTTTNSESSRIGQFIEVQVTDGALYRTKIHCYFLDQTRVIRPLPKEKNYHIFYQMLAGLSREERVKLNLEGYSPANLRYLQSGDIGQNEQDDALRFQAWKTCLGILGIPFLDVVRVLAAVLLLGNVQFIDGGGLEVDVKGETELNSVASLLGVPPAALFRGLTTRTHNARGQLVKSVCDANMSNMTRDCLAKALYCRTVATIVRRANSLKRLGSTLGTLSSDSNESVHNQADVASQHASTIGGNSGSKSMAALNNAVRHATDGFIGILDMFGFEEPSPHAQLEHLCINLCAETMQHFYNTHIFKSSVESCRDEGINCDTEVDYVDNVPCIDLISSLRTGLLSMLDAECAVRGTAESYVAKIKVQHRSSTRLESKQTAEPHDPRMFLIRHFAGRVEYDATDFLDTNRDVVPDDLVAVFYKHTCNFGFATHLFGSELKALYAMQNAPRGLSFRISPTSHSDLLNGDEPVSTLTQDFHTRLDNLLRTLVHARPHFVRCIRSNGAELLSNFERATVVRQIRALQVLETVNLMASGFPHRMRFKQFNARYRMLAPFRLLRRTEDKALDDCNLILQQAMENPPPIDGSVTLAWAPGKRHVFLSEGIRQHLEHLRTEIRNKSATLIQANWRGWQWRKKMGSVKRTPRGGILHVPAKSAKATTAAAGMTSNTNGGSGSGGGAICGLVARHEAPRLSAKSANLGTVTRPRPQPIAGTPPPDPNEKCDQKIIQQTCSLFGLDLERPPPVPPSRAYTIAGNTKLGYPQSRIMKMNFPEDSLSANPVVTTTATATTTTAAATQATTVAAASELQLKKGETVTVVAASTCRGHLIVEHKGQSFHVPFQFMELVVRAGVNANNANNSNNNISNNNNANANAATTTATSNANAVNI